MATASLGGVNAGQSRDPSAALSAAGGYVFYFVGRKLFPPQTLVTVSRDGDANRHLRVELEEVTSEAA